jgi:hypothetical protein
VQLQLEIRTPKAEEMAIFQKCDDTIQKLQMIQDWKRDKEKYTTPLKDVNLLLFKENKEIYRAITGEIPVKVKVGKGVYTLRCVSGHHAIISDRLDMQMEATITIGLSENPKQVLLIMLPSK